MLEFTVQVSETDLYAANRHIFRTGWRLRQVLIAFACSTVMLASPAFVTADQAVRRTGGSRPEGWPTYEPLALAIAAGFAALYLATRFITCWYKLPSASNKLHVQTGTLMMPATYRLTAERFQSSFEEGSSDHPWSRFMDYIDAESVILLRRTAGFLYIIPKQQLTTQQNDDLLDLLEQVGVKRG